MNSTFTRPHAARHPWSRSTRCHEVSDFLPIFSLAASVVPFQMPLAQFARSGEPKVRRSGSAGLSACRDLTADSIIKKSLAGEAVTSLTVFGHAIDAPAAIFLDTAPNILGSACCITLNCSRPNPCPQAEVSAGSQRSAGNYAELHCNHYKDANFRWGVASFFTSAPQEPHQSPALARCSPRAVCARGRTVLAATCEPAHYLGLHARLLFELNMLVCGSLACAVAVKNAVVASVRWQ